MVVFILLVEDSHFCYLFIGDRQSLHPVLKRACPSEKIPSHVFMNRAMNISPNVSCLSRCRQNWLHEDSV